MPESWEYRKVEPPEWVEFDRDGNWRIAELTAWIWHPVKQEWQGWCGSDHGWQPADRIRRYERSDGNDQE